MKILYVAEASIPGQKADSIHAMRMCRSLATAGNDVHLLAFRDRHYEDINQCFQYYGVEPAFAITLVKFPGRGRLASVFLAFRAVFETFRKRPYISYTRSVVAAFFMSSFARNLVFESHTFLFQAPRSLHRFFFRTLIRKKLLTGMVVISQALKDLYLSRGVDPLLMYVAHDGADLNPLDSRVELKGQSRLNVGYFGSAYKGRGIERIMDMAYARPHINFHLFGASDGDMNGYGHVSGNVHFYGFLPPSEIHWYRNACDVLVAPYQYEVFVSSRASYSTSAFMSPLKIFEYMSSGKAMIVSDMPVLREVLSPGEAIMAPPDDSFAWIDGLDLLEKDPGMRKRLGDAALNVLREKYTWDKRAEDIMIWCASRIKFKD